MLTCCTHARCNSRIRRLQIFGFSLPGKPINRALAGSTALRAIERAFPPLSRGKLARHAHLHVKSDETRRRRIAARAGVGIGVDTEPRVAPAAPALLPKITSPEHVVSELARLRLEAQNLYEAALARSDFRGVQNAFSHLINLVDRYGPIALAALRARHKPKASGFVFTTATGGHPRRSNLRQREPNPICSATRASKQKKPAVADFYVVEVRRLELLTPYMRSKCSTS
jgi:hypothetical protein